MGTKIPDHLRLFHIASLTVLLRVRYQRHARQCAAFTYNHSHSPMKAYVYVSLKRSVLDPQGKTIQGALQKLGYQRLQDVRQGKFFELTLERGLDRTQAEAEIERIARDVLTNPVIEEFRYSIEE